MSGSAADDDPGWPVGPRLLLFLVPGYQFFAHRNRGARDGLVVLREIWLALTLLVVLFGVVAPLVVRRAETSAPTPWALALSLGGLFTLVASRSWGRGVDCADPTLLAGTYRTLFFLRAAIFEAVAMFGWVATFVTGHWWLYWLAAVLTLTSFARSAPTRERLAAEQRSLSARGCRHDLVQALRGPSSPDERESRHPR